MAVFYVIGAVFILLFALVGYFTSDRYQVRKELEITERISVAQLVEGQMAKVMGTVRVRDGRKLTAPLSGRECVFYEVVVTERVQGVKHSHVHERIRDVDQVDFDLDDGTGVVQVRARDMKYIASVDERETSGFLDDATPALEAYLQRHGTGSVGLVFNKSMRYREGVFAVGERIAVCGRVTMEEDSSGEATEGADGGAPKKPCLVAPPGGWLIASDESQSTDE